MRSTSRAEQSRESCSRPATPTDPPACALGDEDLEKVADLLATVAGYSVAPPQRTASGYSLRLAASEEARTALSEFIRRDKMCCPFLEFEVAERPGQVSLHVSGPPDAARLLDLCFAAAEQGAATSPG
jgi:hypothetical protein